MMLPTSTAHSTPFPHIKELYKNMMYKEEFCANFDELFNFLYTVSRNIWIGDLTSEVGDEVESYIRFFNMVDDYDGLPQKTRKPIILNVTSNGGDLDACFTIIDAIDLSKTPVYTVNIGCAYSGGALIAMAGHKRFAYPHSTFMLHEGSIAAVSADAHKFRNFNDFYNSRVEEIRRHILYHTKISEEEYEKNHKDDWWFDAAAAKEAGIIDEIMDSFPTFEGNITVENF